MANHKDLAGGFVDKIGWIQSTDPASDVNTVGQVEGGRAWIDTTSRPWILKIYDDTILTWQQVGTIEVTGNARVKYVEDASAGTIAEYMSRNGTDWVHTRTVSVP